MACTKKFATTMSIEAFLTSVNVLINKPHVINKKLWGRRIIYKFLCKPLNLLPVFPFRYQRIKSLDSEMMSISPLLHELGLLACDKSFIDSDSNEIVDVYLLELVPKNFNEVHAFQVVCLFKTIPTVLFFDVTPENLQQNLCPRFSYALKMDNYEITLNAHCDETNKSFKWLVETVLPQCIKWGEEAPNIKQNANQETLTLVSNDHYYAKYNELKLKYGKAMVKIWPECTDPSKFVYEDVAIATYLLLLMEENMKRSGRDKQTFVDLGCGNGLLVYILTMEGFHGVGIDVRKRQIWDLYPQKVKLEVKTIEPSDLHLFPDTDWIIGNHSDELTPWIPVIAGRSSYNCNFFVLPCCAYNFNGSKYQRQNSSKSQYMEYLEYINDLCKDCGFNTDVDRLKIPSTKRICIVGRGRTYLKEDHNKYFDRIKTIVCEQTKSVLQSQESDKWIKDFKAREQVEKVRNCTQLEKKIIETIVDYITKYLLEDIVNEEAWSPGKLVDIHQLVELIPGSKLKYLKNECGGLQTLLKNNHHIFKVQNGKVQVRYPKSIEEIHKEYKNRKSKQIKLQKRPCWFFSNHPQGCPLSKENCSYKHVAQVK